jgi:hypothetical protein
VNLVLANMRPEQLAIGLVRDMAASAEFAESPAEPIRKVQAKESPNSSE